MNGIHEVTGSIPVWSTNFPASGVNIERRTSNFNQRNEFA
jgi:hypothetical protein